MQINVVSGLLCQGGHSRSLGVNDMYIDGKCEYCSEPFRLATINCKEAGMPLCCDPAQDKWLANNATESMDGNQHCVLVGENLQEGVAY